MRDLTLWECYVAGEPGVVVRVVWHKDHNCGVSYVEPKDQKGAHRVIGENDLIPKAKMPGIRADLATDMSRVSSDVLKERLSALRTARAAASGARKTQRRRGTKSRSPSKGGLLGLINKLTADGLDLLEKALSDGKSDDEISKIIKENLTP